MSQSWSFPQAKSQSEFAAQLSPTRPRVQVPDVQMPVPVQVNVTVLQVPAAAAVQVPVGLVQVRMLPVWAAVRGPAVSVVPLQVVLRNETPLSGTTRSEFAAQLSPTRPRVQVPDVQMPVPVQVNVTVLQVPAAAAVQVPVGLVQVRMLPVWAAVRGPAVSVVPLQVVLRNETPLSGTT